MVPQDHPLIEVGVIELNRNPEIYFAEVEQSAFNPVHGPRCPIYSYHRDGAMGVDGGHGSTLGYEPNGYGEWQQQSDFTEPPLSLERAVGHWNCREDDEYYTQPGLLFRLMRAEQQKVLFANTCRAMGGARREIKISNVGNCLKAEAAYGKR